MKIAVTSTGKDLNADIDPRFGRAAYFIVVDPETMAYEVVDNAQNLDSTQGAGIQAGKTIVQNHADALITGFCGPKAFHVLNHAGVKIITNVKGRIVDAITQYKNGELELCQEPNVEGHWA
jgi:predicted Fe-Mo cluster-binding NifX family protein